MMFILCCVKLCVLIAGRGRGKGKRRDINALFIVILHAYAEPKTEECQIEVRMLSIIMVGPKEYATAWCSLV